MHSKTLTVVFWLQYISKTICAGCRAPNGGGACFSRRHPGLALGCGKRALYRKKVRTKLDFFESLTLLFQLASVGTRREDQLILSDLRPKRSGLKDNASCSHHSLIFIGQRNCSNELGRSPRSVADKLLAEVFSQKTNAKAKCRLVLTAVKNVLILFIPIDSFQFHFNRVNAAEVDDVGLLVSRERNKLLQVSR